MLKKMQQRVVWLLRCPRKSNRLQADFACLPSGNPLQPNTRWWSGAQGPDLLSPWAHGQSWAPTWEGSCSRCYHRLPPAPHFLCLHVGQARDAYRSLLRSYLQPVWDGSGWVCVSLAEPTLELFAWRLVQAGAPVPTVVNSPPPCPLLLSFLVGLTAALPTSIS